MREITQAVAHRRRMKAASIVAGSPHQRSPHHEIYHALISLIAWYLCLRRRSARLAPPMARCAAQVWRHGEALAGQARRSSRSALASTYWPLAANAGACPNALNGRFMRRCATCEMRIMRSKHASQHAEIMHLMQQSNLRLSTVCVYWYIINVAPAINIVIMSS